MCAERKEIPEVCCCFYGFLMSVFPVCLSFEQPCTLRVGRISEYHPGLKYLGAGIARDIQLNCFFANQSKWNWKSFLKGRKGDICKERCWLFYILRRVVSMLMGKNAFIYVAIKHLGMWSLDSLWLRLQVNFSRTD